jgi:hypothetical protein
MMNRGVAMHDFLVKQGQEKARGCLNEKVDTKGRKVEY